MGRGVKNPAAWPRQAYLDALRPDPGAEVRGAIVASYSADIRSIVAALLALIRRDDEDGSGDKAALAEAVERLRGKVRILVQRGRIARPRRMPLIAGILDQFVHEIDFDERERSWHPKVSLVAFEDGAGATAWRLWLGSRNLTVASNREFGLLLTSTGPETKGASPIPGSGEMAEYLARLAEVESLRPSLVRRALGAVCWAHPEGMRVERITLTGRQGVNWRPSPPGDVDMVVAVSPFLDGGIVRTIGRWGGPKTRRFLLSTEPALAKIAGQAARPLAGSGERLFVLEGPTPEAVEPADLVPDEGPAEEDDESEQILVGLHAKIFAVLMGKQLRLWVGSANATERAWNGTNVEVIAEITAPASVAEGITSLMTRPVSAAVLEAGASAEETAKDELEEARKTFVAKWDGKLEREGGVFRLVCKEPPHPENSSIRLEAGLATGPLLEWPSAAAYLPLGEYAPGLQTELVQFRLTAGPMRCGWLQRVEVSPPLQAERDRRAIVRHLGPSGMAALFAALFAGDGFGGGGEPWDAPSPSESAHGRLFEGEDLTLDAMLASWVRDAAAFRRAAQRIDAYLGPTLEMAVSLPPEDVEMLRRFQAVWTTVSQELLKDR
jgi:hypothetical protein